MVSSAKALKTSKKIVSLLQQEDYRSLVCGSIRRGESECKSVIIVTLADPSEVKELLADFHPTHRRNIPSTNLIVVDDLPIFIVSTTEEAWGAALIFYTGPHQYKRCVCWDATLQGYLFNKSGLWVGKVRYAGKSEEQILQVLGLPYTEPSKRKAFLSEERRKLRDERKLAPGKTKSLASYYKYQGGKRKARRSGDKEGTESTPNVGRRN
jgi:DNA polymerase/3'-5' exonuclease PolX